MQKFVRSRLERINHFDLYARYSSLEEKFRVFNNDEVADALHARLFELQSNTYDWLPEVLSVLLELSDRPIENSKIEDLEKLKPAPLPTSLTWADIIADDPLDNQNGLWDEVDFAANGSEEDDYNEDQGSDPESSLGRESENENSAFDPTTLIVSTDSKALKGILGAQFWKKEEFYEGTQSVAMTETQMIREVLFMLSGLPTSIFKHSPDNSLVPVLFNIKNVSQGSIHDVLHRFAIVGDELHLIRAWTKRIETVPLNQNFQAVLESRMSNVEKDFSEIQSHMLNSSSNVFPSLLDLFKKVSLITRFMHQIADVIRSLHSTPLEQVSFKILELLYDKTCLHHSIGDMETYMDMATLFFDCFHTYLKPVIFWMEFGELGEHDEVFFIKENEKDVSQENLWQEKYVLILNGDGVLHAPSFLHVAAKKISTTGKSVNILKRLGQKVEDISSCSSSQQQMDFNSVCHPNHSDTLSPFSELFDVSLERWISSKYHSFSQILRQRLETEFGLHKYLDALEIIYFQRNGILSNVITHNIFERIDQGIEAWNDGFLLTEQFQGVFDPLSCFEANRLAVRPSAGSYQDIQNERRSVKIFSSLRVWYTLPWPIATIVRRDSIDIYQRIFIFLLQVQRAKGLLERLRLLKNVIPFTNSEGRENHLAYSLSHRLLWFANSILTYLTDIVLSATTAEMRREMSEAEDVDGMILVHKKFISKLENQCLISRRLAPIHQAIISLLDLVILFSDTHTSFTGQPVLDLATRSVASSLQQNSSNRRGIRRETDSESSDDGDKNSADGIDVSYISFADMSYAKRLEKMYASFTRLLAFVVAGMQGVHRAGGEACWEFLAEGLAAGMATRREFGS